MRRLEWDACAKASSLSELCRVPAIGEMKSALLGCGWRTVRVGFSKGSDAVSFTMRDWAEVGAAAAASATPLDEEIRALIQVIRVMLVCDANQASLEGAFVGESRGLYANRCIETFAKACGVALVNVKWNAVSGALRAVFASYKSCLDRTSGVTLWRYSPCYLEHFKCDHPRGATEEVGARHFLLDSSAYRRIGKRVVDSVWDDMVRQDYILDEHVKTRIGEATIEYICGGMCGPRETFAPSPLLAKRLSFYLYGSAGVGKSTFIKLYRRGLESSLRRFVNPSIQVNIVKVPLNALTEKHLDCILRVQGVSDWSIERLLEQSIAKGNIALLHLEENPEDLGTQRRLFRLLNSMVSKLLDKYPDCVGHVVLGYTSNYLPEDEIRSSIRVFAHLPSPKESSQLAWAKRKLRLKFEENAPSEALLTLDDSMEPPYTADMRLLNNWWRTLGFHCAEVANKEAGRVLVKATRGGGAQIVVGSYSVELQSSDGYFFTTGERRGGSDRSMLVCEMALKGYVQPGVVVFDCSHYTSSQIDHPGPPLWENRIDRLCRMFTRQSIHAHVCNLGTLRGETDKTRIYGSPSDIRGGVFEFIDDVNNPHSTAELKTCETCRENKACTASSDTRVAVVLARVTVSGQFMLREVLEDSRTSSTHRLTISKQRLLFFLMALPGHPLTSQTVSRAHCVIR